MYDGLVKRLRTTYEADVITNHGILLEAADAIEELSKQHEAQRQNLIALMNDKPRWIPVTERLPEEDGRFLTLYPLKTKPSVWRHKVYGFAKDLVKVDKYEFDEHKPGFYGYDDEYGYYEDKDVTHWMPLPEAPKDGES